MDDDQGLWGRSISSVEILGGNEKMISLIDEKRIDGVIFTSTKFNDRPETQGIITLCHEKEIWVRYLKFEFELIEAD